MVTKNMTRESLQELAFKVEEIICKKFNMQKGEFSKRLTIAKIFRWFAEMAEKVGNVAAYNHYTFRAKQAMELV